MDYFNNIKRSFKLKNYIIYILFALFILISIPINTSGGFKRASYLMFEQIGYTVIAVIALSLVVGFLGELSLGHAAFMAIGAYIGMYFQKTCLTILADKSPIFSLIICMFVGAVVAAIFGFIIGLPALRLKGDYLAIVTLAFGEIVKILFRNLPWFGGAVGMDNPYRISYKYLYIIIFVVALLSIILVKNLIKSKHGRAIMAIRDNEIAAKAMGVNVTYYKLFVFVLSSALAGVAGVLYGASMNQILPTTFDYNYSINNILVIVVIGGMGNINGSIVSAIVVTFINIKLQKVFSGDLAAVKNIIYAMILILIVIYNNAPGLKWFREKYNFRRALAIIKQKLSKKPITSEQIEKQLSNQRDYSADWSKVPTKINMDTIVSTDIEIDGDMNKPDKPKKEGE